MDWLKRALSPTPRIGDEVDRLIEGDAAGGLEPSYKRIKESLGRPLSPEDKSTVTERIRRAEYVAALDRLAAAKGTDAWEAEKAREKEAWETLRAYRDSVLVNAKGPAVAAAAKHAAIARSHALMDPLTDARERVLGRGSLGRQQAVQTAKAVLVRRGTLTAKRGGRTRKRKGRTRRRKGRVHRRKGRKTRR